LFAKYQLAINVIFFMVIYARIKWLAGNDYSKRLAVWN